MIDALLHFAMTLGLCLLLMVVFILAWSTLCVLCSLLGFLTGLASKSKPARLFREGREAGRE